MAKWQLLFIPVLACLILMFSGIFRSHTSPLLSMSGQKPDKKIPPSTFVVTEAEFSPSDLDTPEAVLDKTVQFYDPANIEWLHMKLWQRGEFAQLSYHAEGEFWCGPEFRMRLKMTVKHGIAQSRMEVISDGMSMYQGNFYSLNKPNETWTPFTASGRYGERLSPQVRRDLVSSQGYPSMFQLLAVIRQNVQKPILRAVRWKDKDLYQIRGQWPNTLSEEDQKKLALPFNIEVQECRVYLDRTTFWPHRIEWWGRENADEESRLILQTEYRDPEMNQPLDMDAMTKLFTVPPMKEGE